MITTQTEIEHPPVQDAVEFKAIDYVEFYVGNARQAAHYYRTAFGFTPVAYAGLETGARDRVSYVIQQHQIRFILTSPLGPDGPIAEHVRLHGDGVKDIAFAVDDATRAFEHVVERGAQPVMEPVVMEDEHARFVKASIAAYGDTIHSFVERNGNGHASFPGYEPIKNPPPALHTGLEAIDHVAISMDVGEMDYWIDFYNRVMNFHESHQENILTEYSGMNSKVVQNSTGLIKFPIMEPARGKRTSQIEEYLHAHCGPGAQHIAVLCQDIVDTIKTLRANGIDFLRTPDTYYERLEQRIGKVEMDMDEVRALNILIDRDKWGLLLQTFTKPLQSRPTFFMEIIERQGARGFGGGNIKALFQALEHEQALRGNL